MFRYFDAYTDLTPAEIAEALESLVVRRGWFHSLTGPLEAKVDGSRFTLVRVSRGTDSFFPWVRGSISPLPDGSRLSVFMTLHPSVWAFLALWYVAGFTLLFPGLSRGDFDLVYFVFPLAMAVPLFFAEAHEVKKLLFHNIQLRSRRGTHA